MPTVKRYGPGEEASELVPGDFILTHRHHFLAAMIRLAQKRRFRGSESKFAHWSHAALVERGAWVIEAEIHGVVRSPISKYRDVEYHLVRLGDLLDTSARERVVTYADSQLGEAFGFLDLFGASAYLLFGLPLHLVRHHHEICSSLVVRALQEGGLMKEFDPALTLPADLARRFDITQSS